MKNDLKNIKSYLILKDSDGLPEFDQNSWQISFLDTIIVLLCLMIVLATFPKFSNSNSSNQTDIKDEFLLKVGWDISQFNNELKEQFEDELAEGRVMLEKGDYEIRMVFIGSAFYEQGSAELLIGGKNIIQKIATKIMLLNRSDYKIDVEGHADSSPIKTDKYPSNWELSAARAAGVVKFFLDLGVPSSSLKASGYADSTPLFEETDNFGNIISENQDFNRRIVIRLYFE
ncbi:OmpA family protein [uncultured Algoriphagus sp.]|uniref:OmpA/MotB family protein n=1 Tax=uncultured Algoriphagus sp. TaxID=417365 RepID=UPI002593D3DF|nr:OmpA family protein [uncultured Algoriphagus sp.]